MSSTQYHGNPVSLAVAEAVLTTIEVEEMQANAKKLGDYLKRRITDMMLKHTCIGDVRLVPYNLFHLLRFVNNFVSLLAV